MNDKVKNVVLVGSLGASFALGGAAIAGAADDDSSSSNSSAAATTTQSQPDRSRPQRDDEELLSGDTASRVRQAALARVPGGTIERVETDADGHAAYEAHMVKSDGSRITVYVNKQFEVVGAEDGPPSR
jgi:uncharacterized membrane protein YkoI